MAGERAKLRPQDDRQSPSRVEKAFMVVSALATLTLLAYASWQAVTTPLETAPEARVAGTEAMPDGSLLVHVELVNPGGVGLLFVEVELDCADPSPSLAFEMVPATATREGSIVCPPGTAQPQASVAAWIEA